MRARAALLVLLVVAACGDDHQHEEDTTTGDEAVAVSVAPLRLTASVPGPFVREVRGGCTEGPDACATRGDCEAPPVDCGGEADRMRITAHWSSSDDVDLYVTDRLGDTLSFLRPENMSGGRMLLGVGRSCLPGRQDVSEAATYQGPNVLLGAYTVVLHHFGSCMSGLGTVDVDVTMSAGGRHLATFRATLAPRDRLEALTLTFE